MWKRSPTWPASLQGPDGTLPLAADTDIFLSPCALTSQSLRLGKKRGRNIQGRYNEYKCKQPKRRQKSGWENSLERKASPEQPLECKKNHSLVQKIPFYPWTTLSAPISMLGAISVLTVS